jgi:serine/threonine protein kinase
VSAPSIVEEVFLAALEKPTPADRAAYLDAACKNDPELRRRVERLLHAHPKVGGFLEQPAPVEANPSDHSTLPPVEKGSFPSSQRETASYQGPGDHAGTIIAGRYKLVEEIGEGGMGTVWVAQQTEPVKRIVAVKLIRAGMDSKAVLARFEAERQALALMEHPNIARVLDGGTMPDGRPFFVMELVKGVPITHFCDAGRLTPRQRLELFVPVCQAIQHAHQKGVIHRDIKPSNVLIALYDDKPVPKVIDFGIAKATGQTLTDKSLMTGFGAVVGTPEYMSPEQASLNNLDIDTRSDVYSLGVLLYELLAGSPPFHSDDLKKAGLFEMLRVVREDEPPRPSTKLSTANKLPSISANRGTEPKKLTGLLRNELDWIVMKALEKDRARRYETANGFAADVQRYLAGEAIQAHPPSAAYRLRKFARKHRVALTTAAAFALLLIAAACVSSWLAVKAHRAEATAMAKRLEAEANAHEAKKNSEWAEANARALGKTAQELEVANVAKQMRILGLQVDLDLAELRTDPRIGLLRLAHPLNDTWEVKVYGPNSEGEGKARINSDYPPLRELRQFVTAAVLAAGQDYASLLPPITHDGLPIRTSFLSSKGDRLLTRGADKTARLWDAFTGRQIAILRRKDEKVIEAGLSPDGATAFTHSLDGVVRIWETKDGAFRAETEPRPERIKLKITGSFDPFVEDLPWVPASALDVTQLSNDRLITSSTELEIHNTQKKTGFLHNVTGPVELWDTATGRLVARLDAPVRNLDKFQFLGKRWITTVEYNTLLVFSAEDGRSLARLAHPTEERVEFMDVSPNGRRIATVSTKPSLDRSDIIIPGKWDSLSLRVWDVETGHVQALTTIPSRQGLPSHIRFWIDDAISGGGSVVAWERGGGWLFYRVGRNEPIAEFPGTAIWPDSLARTGDLVHGGNGWIYDTRTWQRLLPPPGRMFHPDLAHFAPDGRFVYTVMSGGGVLIDTRTDRVLPTPYHPWHVLPAQGMVAEGGRLLPPTSKLDLPPELLELWAQVAVRGELDGEGRFVAWDEPTWERKRQELAAKPAPHPDFPFPGHVATDKLHWLRAEFDEANTDADRLRIARELLRRANVAGDRAEAVRWQTEVEQRVREIAPPPRPVEP